MLNDKVAIITGAAAGIGAATALLFSELGAKVVAFDRDETRLKTVAEDSGALAITGDMRDWPSLESCVNKTMERYGRLDILINNAGIYPRRPVLEITEQDWDLMHDVNLKGLFRMSQLAAIHMAKQGRGKIVNISSVTFFVGPPMLAHYVAAKGGVIGLTRSMAKELGSQGVYVNCITPGAIQTESEKDFVTPEQSNQFVEMQSLKRRLKPVDVARVCAFLAGPLSDSMTGQTLNVDAGWVLY